MTNEAKLIRFNIDVFLTGTIPNIIGAIFVIIYFNFFNMDRTLPRPTNNKFTLFFIILVFLGIIIYAIIYNRSIRKSLKLYLKGELAKKQELKLKAQFFGIPVHSIMLSLSGWFLSSLIASTMVLINQKLPIISALYIFIIVFFIGGSISITIAFYIADGANRRLAPLFFPDGDFSDVKRIKNVRIYLRLIIGFWIGGILPVILLKTFSGNYIHLLIQDGFNTGLAHKYEMLVRFTLFISIFMSVVSSIYFARLIGKPMVKLEKAMEKVKAGDFHTSVEVVQIDEVGMVCSGFNSMVKGLKERDKIKDVFGKFVSSKVRDEVLSGDLELGGKDYEASVLFCDIRNFTTISEQLQANEVVGLLNSYFNEMIKPIMDHEGVLDKFIGDAMMAVFGPPSGLAHHADLAVKTALVMRKKLDAFNSLRKTLGEDNIDIGLGINSGNVVAGNIGSSERMEYTVIGDTVNIASRLEGLTKQYKTNIIISEYTYERINNKLNFSFRELDEVRVKGKTKSFKIYEVHNFKV